MMMSCLDEVMRTIEQLASRQRTELLSLVELHNQQLNDCIRTAKTNLLHNGFDGQRILAERAEKENQLIPAYPISTTIITTSTSTTTQNDTNASKKSTSKLRVNMQNFKLHIYILDTLLCIHKLAILPPRKRERELVQRRMKSKFQPINEKTLFYKRICL